MIVLLEPQRAAGFMSGGFRYQQRIGAWLQDNGVGELRAIPAAALAKTVAELPMSGGEREPRIVVDGLFAATAPLPRDVIALLHMVPERADWAAAPLDVIATAATTADVVAPHARSVRVVRPGLDACFAPAGGELGQRAPGPLRVVCTGTACADKGQLLLVEAVCAAGVPCEVTLYGDLLQQPDYVAAVRAAAAASAHIRLQCAGIVAPETLAVALQRADLCVSASRRESFGMAVAEAAATGTPVFAFAAGEIESFVNDGQNGWLLPCSAHDRKFAAVLAQLLRDPARLVAARRNARRPALLDWEGAAAQFAAACRASSA